MPLAGHDLAECRWSSAGKISTPMPLAGHDMIVPAGCCEELVISTPMPLAGHDRLEAEDMYADARNFYSHAPRGA